jgi:hypothetical protein
VKELEGEGRINKAADGCRINMVETDLLQLGVTCTCGKSTLSANTFIYLHRRTGSTYEGIFFV